MSGSFSAPPRPDGLATPAEFVAALGRLRQWSGLTYRQLAAAAKARGDILPPSTVAGALGRATLPKEEFVAAFVRACGLDESDVARWVALRKHLAADLGPLPGAALHTAEPPEQAGDGRSPEPGQAGAAHADPAGPARRADADEHLGAARPEDPADGATAAGHESAAEPVAASEASGSPGGRARVAAHVAVRLALAGAGIAVLLLAVGVILPSLRADGGTTTKPSAPAGAASRSVTVPDGWYHLVPSHVAGKDLCVGEGRERAKRTDRPLAVQRPCRGLVPDTALKSVGDGVYEVQWHHPEFGPGCLTVDGAFTGPGALLAPTDCTGAAHQRFLFDPAGPGFTVRPLHSGLCLGALYGEADSHEGAEIAQKTCTGRPDQVFLLRPVPKPTWIGH